MCRFRQCRGGSLPPRRPARSRARRRRGDPPLLAPLTSRATLRPAAKGLACYPRRCCRLFGPRSPPHPLPVCSPVCSRTPRRMYGRLPHARPAPPGQRQPRLQSPTVIGAGASALVSRTALAVVRRVALPLAPLEATLRPEAEAGSWGAGTRVAAWPPGAANAAVASARAAAAPAPVGASAAAAAAVAVVASAVAAAVAASVRAELAASASAAVVAAPAAAAPMGEGAAASAAGSVATYAAAAAARATAVSGA